MANPKDKERYLELKEKYYREFLIKINKSNNRMQKRKKMISLRSRLKKSIKSRANRNNQKPKSLHWSKMSRKKVKWRKKK